MIKTPTDYEADLKALHDTIKNKTGEFNFLRNLYVNECVNHILAIEDDYERLKYITERLCVHYAGLYNTDSSRPHSYSFTCNMSEVNELTDICKKCFPDYKVIWYSPEDTGGEDAEIQLVKKNPEETLKKLQERLKQVKKDQDDKNQELSKLRSEEHRLRQELEN